MPSNGLGRDLARFLVATLYWPAALLVCFLPLAVLIGAAFLFGPTNVKIGDWVLASLAAAIVIFLAANAAWGRAVRPWVMAK